MNDLFAAEEDPEEAFERFRLAFEGANEELRRRMAEHIESWRTTSKSSRQIKAQAREILEFLNHYSGRNFRMVEVNLKPIEARLKSGITPDQLRAIVVRKSRQWKGTELEHCLRPATLFNPTKCESYLGELEQ